MHVRAAVRRGEVSCRPALIRPHAPSAWCMPACRTVNRMTDSRECWIDECSKAGMWEIEGHPGLLLCNHHHDERLMDVHVPDRQRREDDSLTRPNGDPDENDHRGAA